MPQPPKPLKSASARSTEPATSSEASKPIWLSPPPGSRKPRYTREQIAAAALTIADRDGFEAVSMRRVASELGAGTMTLYYYVRTKDDLTALMFDAITGEVLLPPEAKTQGWRSGFAEIARRTRSAFLAHPWAIDAMHGPQIGPNALLHLEESLAIAASTGLDMRGQLELILAIDDYVFGNVIRYARHGAVGDSEEATKEIFAYIESQMETGELPEIARVFGGVGVPAALQFLTEVLTDDERFERGLEQLLDGMALRIGANRNATNDAS